MPLNAFVGFSLDENKAYLAYPLKKGTPSTICNIGFLRCPHGGTKRQYFLRHEDPPKLWMDEGNFYDIHIDKLGKLATVFYGAVGCSEYGYAWSGSGGSRYFLFVDDEIYHGWGGAPYSIEYERGFHVILPRSGSACDTSDDMLLANADVCHGVANWDEGLHVFNSIGNQLPIWEPDI